MANDPVLPDLTPEQEELLRNRHRAEFEAEMVEKAKTEPVEQKQDEEHVYTNMTNSDYEIPDLGIRSPNGKNFRPETFKPYETKNLRKLYKLKEIRDSKYLLLAIENGQLKKGTVPRHEIEKLQDPLAVTAAQNAGRDFTFVDPLSGDESGPGRRHFDVKLRELQEKDRLEDERTKKK